MGGARGLLPCCTITCGQPAQASSSTLLISLSPRSTAGQGRSAGGGVWALGPIPHLRAWAVLTGLHCPQKDGSHHASSRENGCGACRPATLPEPVGRASPLPSY